MLPIHRQHRSLIFAALLGCSTSADDTAKAETVDFFSEYATLECTLLQCDPERFDSHFADLEECVDQRTAANSRR